MKRVAILGNFNSVSEQHARHGFSGFARLTAIDFIAAEISPTGFSVAAALYTEAVAHELPVGREVGSRRVL